MATIDYTKICLTEFTSASDSNDGAELKYVSWESVINRQFSGLFGYAEDLKNKGIDAVLKGILFQEEFQDDNLEQNFYNIDLVRKIYVNHIMNLFPENIVPNESELKKLKKEVDEMEGSNQSQITALVKKYGILEGVVLAVPYSKLKKDYKAIMGEDTYVEAQPNSVYMRYWVDTELQERYRPVKNDVFAEINQMATVYIFSRMRGELVDITSWLSSITTNVTSTGGNFTLELNLVELTKSKAGNQSYYSDAVINTWGDTNNAAYLQSMIRENDLVFIKFEKIQLEEDNTNTASSSLKVHGNLWDMIGLVDTNTISAEATNSYLTVSGRDLIKLLIEDVNFFIPYQFANSLKTTFGGNSCKIFERLFATGQYQLQFVYSLRSIKLTMGFVIQQLANMEILSDEGKAWLKAEYGNDLSKEFEVSQSGLNEKANVRDGIWGLVKFLVDEKVQHYRIADASISQPDGSILNQLRKICQAPFVELVCDTFGDFYNLIARRPPWDLKSLKEATILKIHEKNSVTESLSFDTDVYSIFQIAPRGVLLGGNDSIPCSYIPMIVLDDYVKMWGNKLYSAVYSYIDYDTYIRASDPENKDKKSPKDTFIEDLCWLIEVMAYKPFTRRGTITIKGDRRIKRGSWILYDRTNEIFYVDAVQNTATVGEGGALDRTTTLNVSRGMVFDFVGGSNNVKDYQVMTSVFSDTTNNSFRVELEDTASYFNLIDLDFLKESLSRNLVEVNTQFTLLKRTDDSEGNVFNDSVVKKGVFDFFAKGYQFSSSVKEENKYDTSIYLPPGSIK